VRAAEASECAADQDKFWEYHDVLFTGTDEDNRGDFSEENLVYMAGVLGMDTQLFEQCLVSNKYADLVQEQINYSKSIGVSSTPTFLLNATPVIGAQPYENFAQLIEAELAAK
jgi:protein-disulfide isomerase